MFDEFVTIKGQVPGPRSVVLAGVHGDEHCGIEAFKELLPSLEIERGEVVFVYGNPRALEKGVRYTEANLNRMFYDEGVSEKEKSSYEYARAQFLKKYLDAADALLDIHSTSVPNSRRFVICEKNAERIVSYLPVPLVVSGFDNVEPGGTDYYMNINGKVGLCLEVGSHDDPEGVRIAREGVLSFLKAQGHIENDLIAAEKQYVHMFMKYYSQTDRFRLNRSFENFEPIVAGELIGIDGEREVRAPRDSVILFAHNGDGAGSEVFLLGEYKKGFV